MAAIFGERNIFFLNLGTLCCSTTLWVKSFVEIALSDTVCFLVKNLKNQNGRNFWPQKDFFENRAENVAQ